MILEFMECRLDQHQRQMVIKPLLLRRSKTALIRLKMMKETVLVRMEKIKIEGGGDERNVVVNHLEVAVTVVKAKGDLVEEGNADEPHLLDERNKIDAICLACFRACVYACVCAHARARVCVFVWR